MGEPAGNWKEIGKVFCFGEPREIGGNKGKRERERKREKEREKGNGGTPGGTNGGEILSAAFRN